MNIKIEPSELPDLIWNLTRDGRDKRILMDQIDGLEANICQLKNELNDLERAYKKAMCELEDLRNGEQEAGL